MVLGRKLCAFMVCGVFLWLTAACAEGAPAYRFEADGRLVLVIPTATATPSSPIDATESEFVATATPEPTVYASPTPFPTPDLSLLPLQRTENILILGTDRRPNDPVWRTDTIMVAAIDWYQERVAVISIPRDLFVSVPNYGWMRINQADYHGERHNYPGGGPALVGQVINNSFQIPTHNYVRVEMDGLVKLVDVVDGITVYLPCDLNELAPLADPPGTWHHWRLPAGSNHLDGMDAKRYATYRFRSNDLDRARRQQQIVWALRERAKELDLLPRIPELWEALDHTFETDLPILQVVRMIRLGWSIPPENVHGIVFDGQLVRSATTSGGAQVLHLRNPDAAQERLHNIFETPPLEETTQESIFCR